jgi:hypothetical protein
MLTNLLRRQARLPLRAGRALSSSLSPLAKPQPSAPVKQARQVDIQTIGSVLAPYSDRTSLAPLPELDSAPVPRDYFRLGGEVRASVLKTHSLGVLMRISPQLPLADPLSKHSPPYTDSPAAEAQQEEEGQQEEEEGEGQLEEGAVGFIGLLPHLEIDFYRKSAGCGLRLDESYSLFVQSMTPEGLIRLSFRPGVRDRLALGKRAVLEALAGE